MRKCIAVLLVVMLLVSGLPLHALDNFNLSDKNYNSIEGDISREDIRGEEYWELKYPHGLFSFAGMQYRADGSQDVYEVAVARQGGTAGDVSVDFKAIDISVEYGKDYVIRVGGGATSPEIEKDEDAYPLMDLYKDAPEINISRYEDDPADTGGEPDKETESLLQGTESPENYIDEVSGEVGLNKDKDEDTENADENIYGQASDDEAIAPAADDTSDSKSLRQLRETALGLESDRPHWREADRNLAEEMKKKYDSFLREAPGAETTLNFAEGEYIKYLYVVPLNDDVPDLKGQSLFSLTNPAGGAVRGDTYMVTMDFVSDDYEKSTMEIDVDSAEVRDDGTAAVTVRRVGGEANYMVVNVGTEEGTAIAGEDYVPGLQELLFTPGMTEQTVVVELLDNPSRSTEREFTIAIDRNNESVNLARTEAVITVPPVQNNLSTAGDAVVKPAFIFRFPWITPKPPSPSPERISTFGESPGKGQWNITVDDFLYNGEFKGAYYEKGDELVLSSSSVSLTEAVIPDVIKLFGVDRINFSWKNQHSHSTTLFTLRSDQIRSDTLARMTGVTRVRSGPFDWRSESIRIRESAWNTTMLGVATRSGSFIHDNWAYISPLTLNLTEYELEIKNEDVEKFDLTNHIIEEHPTQGNRVEDEVIKSEPAGTMVISDLRSIVGNKRAGTTRTGAYRSDVITFDVRLADNEIGRNSRYTGYEIMDRAGEWSTFVPNSKVLRLDADFFKDNPDVFLEDPPAIKIRPVFERIEAELTMEVDADKGRVIGIPEDTTKKKFDFDTYGFKRGDIVSATALGDAAAIVPRWSSNNSSAIELPDESGANVNFTLMSRDNLLRVDFFNPDLEVHPHPLEYLHSVSKPVFEIDGIVYEDHDSLTEKMTAIFDLDEEDPDLRNPETDVEISVTFEYLFNDDYPGANRDKFTPKDAVLTVYDQYGNVRDSYTISGDNGTYTLTGNLEDLGWEATDFATVNITYEDSGRDPSLPTPATGEIVVDFLLTGRNAVIVEPPEDDGDLKFGDIYEPVIFEDVSPTGLFKMYALTPPGFTARWQDLSLDYKRDGIISEEEYRRARDILKEYGRDLDAIRRDRPETFELFYGNHFGYQPRFFNPSRISYDFIKESDSDLDWPVTLIIEEKYSTVIDPRVQSKPQPLAGAQVYIGGEVYETDARGTVKAYDPTFERGKRYLVRVDHKGFEFFTYVIPGNTVRHEFDTTNSMRPEEFNAYHREDEDSAQQQLTLNKNQRTVPVRDGILDFDFTINEGSEGVRADDAIIRIYKTDDEGYRAEEVYRANTGDRNPETRKFEHSLDPMAQGVTPGDRMTIAPMVGDIEYPEVDVGLTFSVDIALINAFLSFDTPAQAVLKFLGKIDNRFDLGMAVSFHDISEPGVRYDDYGKEYNTLSVTFGFDGGQVRATEVSKITKEFSFAYDVNLVLTIEPGLRFLDDGTTSEDGQFYFSHMHLDAEGMLGYSYSKTYPTPVKIPVYIVFNVVGEASVETEMTPIYDDQKRFTDNYRFGEEGDLPIFKSEHYDEETETNIFAEATIGAGAGWPSIFSVEIGGGAQFNYNLENPIFGDERSFSSGTATINDVAYVAVKALFIRHRWDTKVFVDLSYGGGSSPVAGLASDDNPLEGLAYEPVKPVSDDEIITRDYLDNSSGWLGGRNTSGVNISSTPAGEKLETILEEGAYPYPQTKIVEFDDDKLMVLFVGDPGEEVRDTRNRAQLFYSTYDDDAWSEPQPVDAESGTWDEAPDAFVIGDKILVTWADAAREFTAEDTVIDVLKAMNISGMWFNTETAEFEGDKITITKGTDHHDDYEEYADLNPKISYDPASGKLLLYYTKIDYDEILEYEDDDFYDDWDGEEGQLAVYGDIGNAYSVIAYRYAEQQADGSFEWNTGYEEGELYPDYLYGQRFLNLATLVDIEETEVMTEDGFGTEQEVTAATDPDTDPLIVDSDLITYNDLALHAYVMDADGNRDTTDDQELYLQIYNYELNEFHHPIQLTNNDVQDTQPKFVRTKDITYLYWISDGDIVCMDITNLVRNNLKLVEVEIGGQTQNIYIVDKSNTFKDSFIQTVVESEADMPIDYFQIQSNEDGKYIIFTDYVLTPRENGDDADAQPKSMEDVYKERHIFAAYSEPRIKMEDGEYILTEGYEWSRPIRLTYAEGANYSDISFVVDEDHNIRAGYIRYEQELNEEEGYFKADEANRVFAFSTFDVTSTLEAEEVEFSSEAPCGGERLEIKAEVTNTGVKPITRDMQYIAYMKQDGVIIEESAAHDLEAVYYFDEDDRGDIILGGESLLLNEAFELPEEFNNIVMGFKVIDGDGSEILSTEKAVPDPAANLQLTVVDRMLTEKDTARLVLNIENAGNKDYDDKLEINCIASGKTLKELDLQLNYKESIAMEIDLDIDPAMFGETEILEDGSARDELSLEITAGDHAWTTGIRREADKSIVEAVQNVTSFDIYASESDYSPEPGEIIALGTEIERQIAVAEDEVDPLEVNWSSSDNEVAMVLSDGTVIGISPGTAEITARLTPGINKAASRPNSAFEMIDTDYLLPAGMIQEKTIKITVSEPTVIYGDVNENGKVGIHDAILVLRHIVGLTSLDEDQQTRADVDGNNVINVRDAILILRRTAGLIDGFPVEQR